MRRQLEATLAIFLTTACGTPTDQSRTQDEASSVIYGMPMAVAKAGLADEVLPLSLLGPRLAELA